MHPFAAPLLALFLAAEPVPAHPPYFAIEVVDEQTGRGVPMVELETVNNIRLWTDSAGVAAFYEPGLMGQNVFFHVRSHGYEFPKDGFGYRGKALKVTEGGSARITVRRINIAERLYRVIGEGIYRDSVMLGWPVPIKHPLLNGMVTGSDSVLNAIYHGKLYWLWGDTNRPGYPLGNFNTPGATSLLPGKGGLDPEKGVDLDYFVGPDGFARAMAPVPGDGPTWLGAVTVVHGPDGRERMFAVYNKIRNGLETYERGLVEYNDAKEVFEPVARWDLHSALHPGGHAMMRRENGTEWAYFCEPYPLTRVRADADDLKHPERYQAFTCLREGSTESNPQLDRDAAGRIRYAWRPNTPVVGSALQGELVKKGLLKPEEALLQLRDVETGKTVYAHGGSVSWNAFRRRWVMITVESWGTSMLGEVWYAEADSPVGPWVYARKVVTHDRYTFYNPKQHPYFEKEGGRILFFEGTYANTFSGNPEQTPRYDYNQMMYRLDLSDPRLNLPAAVYSASEDGTGALFTAGRVGEVPRKGRPLFFAPDRPGDGLVPVTPEDGRLTLQPKAGPGNVPLFYALPADAKDAPATTAPLYEFTRAADGARAYGTETEPRFAGAAPANTAGFTRSERPLCRVWRSPYRPAMEFELSGP